MKRIEIFFKKHQLKFKRLRANQIVQEIAKGHPLLCSLVDELHDGHYCVLAGYIEEQGEKYGDHRPKFIEIPEEIIDSIPKMKTEQWEELYREYREVYVNRKMEIEHPWLQDN